MGPNPKSEVPVFIQTNLGTRIAIPVSPDITAGEFKREVESAHIECFPELGILDLKRVMVKRKSKFYCIPDLLPLKFACGGCKELWFVNVFGCLSNDLGKFQAPKGVVAERRADNHPTNGCIIFNKNSADIKPKKRNLKGILSGKAVRWGLLAVACELRKKKRRKRGNKLGNFSARNNLERLEQECLLPCKGGRADLKELLYPVQGWDSNPTVDSPSESFSETVSISGIIDRYFSNIVELNHIGRPGISEVATRAGQHQLEEQDYAESTSVLLSCKRQHLGIKEKMTPRLLPSTSPTDCNSAGLRRKYERSEVGERLVNASSTLQQCQSKQRSQKSNLSKGKKFWERDACSVAKCLVFEIGDGD